MQSRIEMTSQYTLTPITRLVLVALLAAAAAFHLATMDSNHRWWGDFALYYAHAKNIATGHPYGDTGFLYNPNAPGYSPPVYPPVYPVMLAPLYKLFGLNLFAPKVLNLLLLLASLSIFIFYFTRNLRSEITRLAILATCLFSPWYWIASNLINSDVPFMLFAFAALIASDRLAESSRHKRGYWLLAVTTGLLVYLAYGTRSVGLLLVPAIVLYDLLRNRSLSAGTLLAIFTFAVCHQLQGSLLTQGMDKSYAKAIVDISSQHVEAVGQSAPGSLLSAVEQLVDNIDGNIPVYAKTLLNHWDNGISIALTAGMTVALGLLALAGFINSLARKSSTLDTFFIVYTCVLMVVPVSQSFRYLMPVLPAFVLYIYHGSELLEARLSGRRGGARLPALIVALVFAGYLGNYMLVQPKHVYFGVTDPEATELFRYIQEHTPADSHIKFHRPRILALFTGRNSSVYNVAENPADFVWEDFRRTGATHLLLYTGEGWSQMKEHRQLLDEHRSELKPVFHNAFFDLYRLEFRDASPESLPGPSP